VSMGLLDFALVQPMVSYCSPRVSTEPSAFPTLQMAGTVSIPVADLLHWFEHTQLVCREEGT
jgi:hypothetical protein